MDNPQSRRRIPTALAVAALLALAACGSDDQSATTQATKPSTTRSSPSTSTIATTSAPVSAPPRTTVRPTTTTTVARSTTPPTTATPSTLSRDAKLAVNQCLDDLSVPTMLTADLIVLDDPSTTDQAIADCDEASKQVNVDAPGSQMSVTLSAINVELTKLMFAYASSNLEGGTAATDYAEAIIPLVTRLQVQAAG